MESLAAFPAPARIPAPPPAPISAPISAPPPSPVSPSSSPSVPSPSPDPPSSVHVHVHENADRKTKTQAETEASAPAAPAAPAPAAPAPAAPAPAPSAPPTALALFDLILRAQPQLTRVLVDERSLPSTVQRLLGLSLLGLGAHGLVVGFAAQVLHADLHDLGPLGHPALWMPAAFVLAFIGALCVCLPSFWFYTQLSGLDASFRLVTGQALRAQATAAVLLLGVTPFYAAVVLACAAGVLPDAPSVIVVGLATPFIVGLYGMRALYKGFCELATVLPITHRRRGDFLRRMVLCWGAVYTAVAPVALYRLAEAFARLG